MTKFTSLTVRPVLVPMRRPLQTAGGAVSEAPLVLIDIGNDAGLVGRALIRFLLHRNSFVSDDGTSN